MNTCCIFQTISRRLVALTALLSLASVQAQTRTWDGGAFIGSSWNSANNWSSNTLPVATGTAVFSTGNNGKTTVGFLVNTTISEIQFSSLAPAYTFNILIPTLDFNISGPGIVNSSTNTQTFNTALGGELIFNGTASAGTNVQINNGVGGITTFNGTSSAGSAVIASGSGGFLNFRANSTAANSTITNTLGGFTTFSGASTAGAATISNGLGGLTTFSGSSNAGTALISSGSLGFLNFTEDSSAAGAIITNTLGGLTTFSGNSTGGNATITNSLLGATAFTGSSTAGAAIIGNNSGGATSFSGNADAGTAVITSGSLGLVSFAGASSGASATILNTQGGLATFSGNSTAGSATITNTLLGGSLFSGQSTAGNAVISNGLGGLTTFSGSANAGSATISSGTLGGVLFSENSHAGTASILNSLGGLAAFSGAASASGATVENTLLGVTTFSGSSTAGASSISNHLGGATVFSGESNAGTATINSGTLGAVLFQDTSSASGATLKNTLGGLALFSDNSTAGNATIVNKLLGLTRFSGSSTAGAADIKNSLGGGTLFADDAKAGSATITSGTLGAVVFTGRSQAETAAITNKEGGLASFLDNSSAGNATILNKLLGVTTFSGSSTAGNALIKNKQGGATVFLGETTAGTATIKNSELGGLFFADRSTASSSKIVNTFGGLTTFLDGSTAGGASIKNKELGGTLFTGSSSAGTAAIRNTQGGFTAFLNDSGAGSATIKNRTLGSTLFAGDASAESATISNKNAGLTTFLGNATAANATIRNSQWGAALFAGDSTAGAAQITNGSLGATVFAGNSSAGTAAITNRSTGTTVFLGDSTANTARIVNRTGGVIDLSGHNGALAIGSVRGGGNIFLGANNLALGGLNLNARISGIISDGGLSGGTGGSLTKNGLARLTLSGANTYTGGTTLNSGLLRTLNSSALGSGPLTLNGGTLNAVGALNVGSVSWNAGKIQLQPQYGGVVNSTGNLINGGAGGTYAIDTTGMEQTTYVLTTFTGATNFSVGNFSGEFTHYNPNVQYQGQFVLEANRVLLQITGARASGEILQNSFPVLVPTFADFFVTGATRTGTTEQDNLINSLTFADKSSLQVFNVLSVTSGKMIVPNGSATVNGGTIVTPGDFSKEGDGTLVANSDFSVAGQALVTAGKLFVNAGFFVQQGLTVLQNAFLGGSGIIFGDVLNKGTVNPGNSPGTLTVVGNYTQASSGTLQLEIASQSVFDRLLVTGNASLAGTLQVFAGNLKYGQQYAFLEAGSIDGEFDRILMPNPSRFRGRLLVDGGTGSLLVAPTSYTLVAKTGNQKNVARALDSFIPARGNDRETVSIALDLQTEEYYPAAFDAITPAFYESLADISIEQVNAQNQMLAQRLSAVRLGTRGFQVTGLPASPLVHDKDGKSVMDVKDGKDILTPTINNKWGVWVQGNGIFAKVVNVSQVPNYRFQSGGFLGGLDYRWSENFATGLYAGYQGTYAKYANGGNTKINSVLFGGYATYQNGGFSSNAIIGGGYSAYAVRRPIEFSTIDRTARSRPDGGQFTSYLDLGYDWKVGNFTMGPILAGQYTYAGIAPFSETGADSLDLRLEQQNANSLRTSLGGRIAYTWKLNDKITLTPEVRMFWQHEFLENPRNIGASLDGGSGPAFDYTTSTPDRDAVFAGAGISAQFGQDWNAFFYYNADFGRQDYLGHMISAGLNWSF